MSNNSETTKSCSEFFLKLGVEATVAVEGPIDQTIHVRVRSSEPKLLVGQGGRGLLDLQHILRLLLRNHLEPGMFLSVDVNDYKQKKTDYLREVAEDLALQVSLTGRSKELPAMAPYERRIIHMALEERTDVITESVGEGSERRIIIRPAPPKTPGLPG